ISYFMLAINSYLAAYSVGIFKISQWKLGPTELRLLLMIGNVFLFYRPRVYHHRYLLFDVGGVIASFGMSLMLVVLSIQHTHTLYKLERLPRRSNRTTGRGSTFDDSLHQIQCGWHPRVCTANRRALSLNARSASDGLPRCNRCRSRISCAE